MKLKKLIAIILALSLTALVWFIPASAEEASGEEPVVSGEAEEVPTPSVRHETQYEEYEYSPYQEDLGDLALTGIFGVLAAPVLLFLFPPPGIAGLAAPFYATGVFFHQLFGIG